MTCKEYRKMMTGKDPRDATVAEATAAYRHHNQCGKCHEWTKKTADAIDKAHPLTAAENDSIKSEAIRLYERLLNDPEAIQPE